MKTARKHFESGLAMLENWDLCSRMPVYWHWLLLVSKKISKRVKKCLNFSDKTVEIIKSPDKPNIKRSVTKVSYSIERSVFWLIDALQNLQEKFPRLLIYCTKINDAAKVYN